MMGTVYDTYYHYNGNTWDSRSIITMLLLPVAALRVGMTQVAILKTEILHYYPSIGQAFFIDHEVVPGYTWTNAFVVPTN